AVDVELGLAVAEMVSAPVRVMCAPAAIEAVVVGLATAVVLLPLPPASVTEIDFALPVAEIVLGSAFTSSAPAVIVPPAVAVFVEVAVASSECAVSLLPARRLIVVEPSIVPSASRTASAIAPTLTLSGDGRAVFTDVDSTVAAPDSVTSAEPPRPAFVLAFT